MSRPTGYSLVVTCLLCVAFHNAFAQHTKINCNSFRDTTLHKLIYKIVDQQPQPVGGIEKLGKQLLKSLKCPSGDADYSGQIIIAFVVEADGKIDGKRIVKDLSDDQHFFSKQVFTIVDHVKWNPGSCNGKRVPVLYILPLNIDLQE